MRKSLTWILIFLIFSSTSARTAFGWNNDATQAAKLKLQVESLPSGASVKVRLNDHRLIKGELAAHSEEGFQLDTPEPIEISYSEVKSIDQPAGQVGTGGCTPSQPAKHHHFVRTLVIGFGAMVAFALIVAVADN